jgi:hypothetical protein
VGIDYSDEMHQKMKTITSQIEKNTLVNEDMRLTELSNVMEDGMDNMEEAADLDSDLQYSVVFPKPSIVTKVDGTPVDSMMDMLRSNSYKAKKSDSNGLPTAPSQPLVVPITREKDPLCEWNQNDVLLGSAFAPLFMLGKGLPTGSFSKDHFCHLSKNFPDDQFEGYSLIGFLFNQSFP